MATSEESLRDIDAQLEKYVASLNKYDEKEATLNAQIASIRLQIAELRDSRFQKNQEIKRLQKDRESALRKRELEKEAAEIERTLAEKRKEAEEILANAPWKDVAFPWQIDGAIMLPERALLGDKRGLGKTLSALMWRRFKKSKRTLVCLRKEVASDFIKEINIREPGLFVYNLVGVTAEQRTIAASLLNNLPDNVEYIVVTNIESWRRNVEKTIGDLLQIKFDGVILDEAHHIKNVGTGTAQGFFKIADAIGKVLEMTGTPIKNRPQEMFSLLHALYPHIFVSEKKFLYDFCVIIGQNRWAFSETGLKELVKKISSFYIARTPEDIGRNVPPPRMIEYKLDFENHLKQKKAYTEMAERSLAILDSGKVLPIVSQLALMTRQAQMVSWPAGIKFTDPETLEIIKFDIHESVKIDWAEDLLEELTEEGERTIVFSRFKPAIYELKYRLEQKNLRVAVITGDEPKGNTERVFNDFDLKTASKGDYQYDILLATYQTVGESANLNAAGHMILFDRFWNPGNDDQAIGRIDRINSTRQATVHLPYVEKTIDVYMAALIDEKRNIVTGFKDAASQQAALINHLRDSL